MSQTDETLAALKAATNDLNKSITQATGLVNYDLQAPAKLIYPLITPLRNSIPRVKGDGGTATNWRVITSLNGGGALGLVGEGNRGGLATTTVATKSASYKTIGLDDYVTFEAELAAQGFDDAKALSVRRLLQATMQEEERQILWGNNSVALGTTATPSLTGAATGGGLSDGAHYVNCVALTGEAWKAASVSATGVPVASTRTNADGSTDTINGGAAQKSAEATVTLSGGGSAQKITATVTAVAGAAGYAWYIGTTTGQAKIAAITTINSYVFTALPDSGNQLISALPAADKSKEDLAFDGLISQIITSGSGAYVKTLATGTGGTGTVLTSNGNAGITEIDDLLADRWNNYKLDPDEIWVSGKMFVKMNALIMANGSAPLVRLQLDGSNADKVVTNRRVAFYQNPITGKVLEIKVHPDMPDSWILVRSTSIPYAISNVANPLEIKYRRDYHQIEYPLRSRKYEYGVYINEVLACYFPPAFGLITNVATGKADGT